jgi:hypothetical protein
MRDSFARSAGSSSLGAAAGVLALFASACGDCAGLGIAEIRPGNERTLSVGANFTAEYWTGGTCAGSGDRHIERADVRWWTGDTLVVRVDSLSGLVRAVGPGDGRVLFRSPGAPAGPESFINQIVVHVR